MELSAVEREAGPWFVLHGAHIDDVLVDAPEGELSQGRDVLTVDADREEENGEYGDVEGYFRRFLEV